MSLSLSKDLTGLQLFYLENNYSGQPYTKSQAMWLRIPPGFLSE